LFAGRHDEGFQDKIDYVIDLQNPGFADRNSSGIGPRNERSTVGSVIKKRRKRMAKKKHRKLLKKTRIQRRRAGK
jgi:hypothetical protein